MSIYESLYIEVVEFDTDDIVCASGCEEKTDECPGVM